MKIRELIFAFIFCGLTSCNAIFTGLYGIKKLKTLDENTIVDYAKKYNIPLSDSYKMDTSYYSFLLSLDTAQYSEQIKNHYQPLQVLYYNKLGKLESFQLNCYTGGFPNLKWDRNEIMTIFPPKEQAPLDSILPLSLHLNYLQQLPQTVKIETNNYDYVVIVHWNRFMGRQSKRLIRTVQENTALAKHKTVKILYVNTDNLFAKQLTNGNN